MVQLGSGSGSSYPSVIDTKQMYQNTVSAGPDSDTRVDSEYLNDTLTAIVQMQTTLGAGIQGAYASLAARLSAIEAGIGGGGGGTPLTNVVTFTGQTMVTIPGAAHQQGQQALLYQVYDASTPRQALQPESFAVYPGNYDAVLTFGSSQSGTVILAALTPQYVTAFTTAGSPASVTIPGTTHGLASPYLFVQAYDLATPAQATEFGSVSVNVTTRDVTLTTTFPVSGTLVLGAGTLRYTTSFTNASAVTVLGTTHGLASRNLLFQVYDASPDPQLMQPGSLSVHPTSFDVVLTFGGLQSGTLLLAPAPTITPVVLMAATPSAHLLPMPLRTTPLARESGRMRADAAYAARLQATIERLTQRLETLETAHQTLLTQLGGHRPEDPA